VYDLIRQAEREHITLAQAAQRAAMDRVDKLEPVIPLHPKEVWGCGCTYEASAAFRDAEHGTREGFYAAVYKADRPEVFFKGTARVCVGPRQAAGIRADSVFTAVEPELAVILGSQGGVIGYTLADDVSAWDIEQANPLYLPQSKTFSGCCVLGPVILTPDEVPDIRALTMHCRITRGGKVLFEGSTPLTRLGRSIDSLIGYLMRSNPVPSGSVLLTGTGIIVPREAALEAGDEVRIAAEPFGELIHTAAVV
jgi:2-dehydro-3-deoxy-D-arabinonate dehydratase